MTELEIRLYCALTLVIKNSLRIPGCGDPVCLICVEKEKVITDALSVIDTFEAGVKNEIHKHKNSIH